MPKKKSDLKIFYVQIRKDQETRDDEFSEFVRFSKLEPSQFTVQNVFDAPHFEPEILDAYDAFFIGGSSDDPDDIVFLDPAEYPYITDLKRIIQYAAKHTIPTFASCMGFQIGAQVLGGEVIVDKKNLEVGTYPIFLTDIAKKDVLFADTSSPFIAVSGHKKRVKTLPPGAVPLAYSALCPFHAFRLEGKPFYAFQFHPEIDQRDMIARLKRYKDRGYFHPDEVDKLIASIEDTSLANALVGTFVDRILLG